jgi:hypothetical protein
MINTLSRSTIFQGAGNIVKKVIIEILLVPQSLDKPFDEIDDEILKEFREGFLMIPWGYKIEKIKVIET